MLTAAVSYTHLEGIERNFDFTLHGSVDGSRIGPGNEIIARGVAVGKTSQSFVPVYVVSIDGRCRENLEVGTAFYFGFECVQVFVEGVFLHWLGIGAVPACEIAYDVVAVSYTHLDVYKRKNYSHLLPMLSVVPTARTILLRIFRKRLTIP